MMPCCIQYLADIPLHFQLFGKYTQQYSKVLLIYCSKERKIITPKMYTSEMINFAEPTILCVSLIRQGSKYPLVHLPESSQLNL